MSTGYQFFDSLSSMEARTLRDLALLGVGTAVGSVMLYGVGLGIKKAADGVVELIWGDAIRAKEAQDRAAIAIETIHNPSSSFLEEFRILRTAELSMEYEPRVYDQETEESQRQQGFTHLEEPGHEVTKPILPPENGESQGN